MPDLVLATCRAFPELPAGDRLLAAALEQQGARVGIAAWNDGIAPFAHCDLVAVRSTWDYPQRADEFAIWLEQLESVPGVVVNPPALMQWNRVKSYLLALRERGVRIPATAPAEPDAVSIAAALDALELDTGVVKPLVGATASGLSVVRRDDSPGLARAALHAGQPVLVQELLPAVRTSGEVSLVYFDHEFSHAVVKRPADGSILVQEEHGGSTDRMEPSAAWIDLGTAVLDALPDRASYARVDLVEHAGEPLVMEVELIEPELFLSHAPEAADRFAALLLSMAR